MRDTSAENGGSLGFHHYLKPILFGLVIGILVSVLSFVGCAFLMVSRDIPQSLVSMLAVASASLGGFFAGFIAARMAHSKGLLLGLICGLVISAVILIAGLSVMRQLLGITLLIKFLMIIAASCLGGVIGVNCKKRRRKS